MAFEELTSRQAVMWGSAPFENIADLINDMHFALVERLAPEHGEHWLDLPCGAGDVALRAARAGAAGTGPGTVIVTTEPNPSGLPRTAIVTIAGRPLAVLSACGGWAVAHSLPMAFAPRGSGELPETLPAPGIDSKVPASLWREMERLARQYLERLQAESALSPSFAPCLKALEIHLQEAGARIGRLAWAICCNAASIKCREMLIGSGKMGSASGENHSAASISLGSGVIVPPA